MTGLTGLTDEELARRARFDPQSAFSVLFERYRSGLYNFLLRQGASEEKAEDLFQQAFLKVFRALPGFREEARFKTWLYSIAVNVLRDDRRSEQRREATARPPESIAVPAPEPGAGEERERVEQILGQIQPHHRQLFVLVRFQGLSIAEASRALGMTPAAAKVTLFRTTRRIGELLVPVRENGR